MTYISWLIILLRFRTSIYDPYTFTGTCECLVKYFIESDREVTFTMMQIVLFPFKHLIEILLIGFHICWQRQIILIHFYIFTWAIPVIHG